MSTVACLDTITEGMKSLLSLLSAAEHLPTRGPNWDDVSDEAKDFVRGPQCSARRALLQLCRSESTCTLAVLRGPSFSIVTSPPVLVPGMPAATSGCRICCQVGLVFRAVLYRAVPETSVVRVVWKGVVWLWKRLTDSAACRRLQFCIAGMASRLSSLSVFTATKWCSCS